MITIIQGRGNKRRPVLDLPHASVVARSAPSDVVSYHGLLCDILGVAFPVPASSMKHA